MWKTLENKEQLYIGSKLKQSILEGDISLDTIYKVKKIGEYHFLLTIINQNDTEIQEENQPIIPFNLNKLIHYGFKIWIN